MQEQELESTCKAKTKKTSKSISQKEAIKLFKGYVKEFLYLVPDFNIEVEAADLGEGTCAASHINNNYAMISLNINPHFTKHTKEDLKDSALHEVIHVVISPLMFELYKFYSCDYVESLIEPVVVRLEKILRGNNLMHEVGK
jgi:hypothetical protein